MNDLRLVKLHWFHVLPFLVLSLCGKQALCSLALPVVVNSPVLKVMTLNLAHGRKAGLNQLLMSEAVIRNNLGEIAAFLDKTGADVVALQEADAPSLWSGSFDHVAVLAEQAGYPVFESSNQATSWFFSYGTALLSKVNLSGVVHHTFRPSPPTMSKGYTLGQIMWQSLASEPVRVDIVSVHLDFSRKSVREQQSAELRDTLACRGNPIIIMGDFNSDWFADEKVVRSLAERIGLHGYQPEAGNLSTYRSGARRFDWILISKQLEFVSFEVMPDILSDHFAVVAEIAMKPPGGSADAL
jgi:endonuclease/exonuclease/phosphatase family metal-dependent hydrolase